MTDSEGKTGRVTLGGRRARRQVSAAWPAILIVGVCALVSLPVGRFVPVSSAGAQVNQQEAAFAKARSKLVDQLRREGLEDERVLEALDHVPRHEFVPDSYQNEAYGNYPLPIGHGQTISQPYIVGLMTQLLDLEPGARVLEIGTGSGYQAAVLAEVGYEVFSIEIVEELGRHADTVLDRLGYDVEVRVGDGYAGWPEEAPFDGIIVTAAPPQIPDALVQQLRPGGRMVVPVGPESGHQVLQVVSVDDEGEMEVLEVAPVRFVPMVHEERQH